MKSKSLLLTIAVLLGLRITATAQTPPSYVPTDGLVGWWPFNGNANDESGNGNDGTVNGATLTEDRFGVADAAYGFDGLTNSIEIPNSNSLIDMSNISVSAWYKVENWWYDFANNGWFPIISKTNSPSYGFYRLGAAFESMTNEVGIYCTFSTNAAGVAENNLYDLNIWNHIVYSINGDSAFIFVNGVLEFEGQTEYTGWPTLDSLPLVIGKDVPGYIDYADGNIDDIGIWNRALTQEEITNLFNASAPSSISSSHIEHNLNIFPNPTEDRLTLEFGKGASLNGYALVIENSLGQQVYEAVITQQTSTISMGSLAGKGLYFVRIFDTQGNAVDVRKVVVE